MLELDALRNIETSLKAVGMALILTLCTAPAFSADYCAVRVSISNPDDKPINSTWIELTDPQGKIVLTKMVGADFEICDFGFGAHTLRIGTNECLPVSISNLQVVIGHPLSLHVVLNACGYRGAMRNGCFVYVRTVDEGHQPLPQVEFSPRLVLNQPPRTDSFGRWQSLVLGTHELTFVKPGYKPSKALVECRAQEELDVEVVLTKQVESPR